MGNSANINNYFLDFSQLIVSQTLLEGKPLGTVSSGDDPIQIVTRSWPWKDLDGGFSQSLRPLFKHSLHTNNDNNAPADDNIFNKDPLVSLLEISLIVHNFTFQPNKLLMKCFRAFDFQSHDLTKFSS